MQTEADFWPLNYADFGARKDGRKEEQKDAKTGTTEIWPTAPTVSAPNLCGARIKLVSICQAENSQKPRVGVRIFNHGWHGWTQMTRNHGSICDIGLNV